MRLKRIAAASDKPTDSPSYSSTTVTAVSFHIKIGSSYEAGSNLDNFRICVIRSCGTRSEPIVYMWMGLGVKGITTPKMI